jgi:hypothetical protein
MLHVYEITTQNDFFFNIKGRDVMANIMAIVEDRKMKFLQFVAIFLAFEARSSSH